MKLRNKALLPVLVVCMLFTLNFTGVMAEPNDSNLTIVFTHDLHSHIDTIEQEGTQRGGFAKIKAIINAELSKNPAALIVDAGDFSMGSIFQSAYSKEAIELRLLGLMGYDAVTLGNHEFDYTAEGLYKMLDAAKSSTDPLPLILQSNTDWEKSEGEHTQRLKEAMNNYGVVYDYAIIEKGGIRVALFGLMGEEADSNAPTSGLKFTDIADRAAEVVADIKKNANTDIIVCLSHSGINEGNISKSEDVRLAKKVPDIDVIISGHSHTLVAEPIVVGNTAIVSAGEYGEQVGIVTLKPVAQALDRGAGKAAAEGRWIPERFELVKVSGDIQPDGGMLNKIDSFRKYLDDYVEIFGYESTDQVIAYNPYTYPTVDEMKMTQNDQALGNLISDSYVYAVKEAEGGNYVHIDAAIVPVGVIRSGFKKGNITVNDVYEVSSLGIGADGISGYPLVSVYLTGAELRTVAEVDASVSLLMKSAQLYSSGLHYEFNPMRLILNRVTKVMLAAEDGELRELDDSKLYRVVSGLYSAQMLGAVQDKSFGLLKITPKDKDGIPIADYSKHIILDKNNTEVKEWYALSSYLDSFPETDGVSVIPDEYAAAQGRKTISTDNSIVGLLKNPNKIFFIVLALILVILALILLLVFSAVKHIKKRRAAKQKTLAGSAG